MAAVLGVPHLRERVLQDLSLADCRHLSRVCKDLKMAAREKLALAEDLLVRPCNQEEAVAAASQLEGGCIDNVRILRIDTASVDLQQLHALVASTRRCRQLRALVYRCHGADKIAALPGLPDHVTGVTLVVDVSDLYVKLRIAYAPWCAGKALAIFACQGYIPLIDTLNNHESVRPERMLLQWIDKEQHDSLVCPGKNKEALLAGWKGVDGSSLLAKDIERPQPSKAIGRQNTVYGRVWT